MNKKLLRLAAMFLDVAAEEFSNHGCKDFDFPKDWTKEEQQEFNRAVHLKMSGEEETFRVNDWMAMRWIAEQLRETEEL